MNFTKKIKEKTKGIRDFFFDHPGIRQAFELFITLLAAALSAFIFAYGYKSFVAPVAADGEHIPNIVTGGASGISQIIVKICELCGIKVFDKVGNTTVGYIIQSTAYVLINIPLAILAFRKIGKRFALFTAVNVGLYFVFVNVLPTSVCNFYYSVDATINLRADIFVRALLAGICTGLSTGCAVEMDHSAGGIDIISIFVTTKRTNASMGKVSMLINIGIISVYTLLSCIQDGGPEFITMALYSSVYFFVCSVVIDGMVSRNKKSELQIITENEKLPEIFITYFPHSATVLHGQGAYTKKDKIVIYTVISTSEVKKAIKIIQEIDPKSFITVTKVNQLVGRFYIEPHK